MYRPCREYDRHSTVYNIGRFVAVFTRAVAEIMKVYQRLGSFPFRFISLHLWRDK
jgi:hypothetical protein